MLQTLYHVSEYKEELLYPAICKAMDALSIADDLRPGLKVVIKPNLVMAKSPDFPVTTHPLVVKAVVHYLRGHGVTDITLAESSGGLYNTEHMKNLYRVCGMSALEPDIRMNMDFTSQTIPTRDGSAAVDAHVFPNRKGISPICRMAGMPEMIRYTEISSTQPTVINPSTRKIPCMKFSKNCFFFMLFTCYVSFFKGSYQLI